MNGAENLRGVDYQISYALLHILRCLLHEGELPQRLALEDLTDEGADIRLAWEHQPGLHIQVKKLSEGYQWSLRRLAPVVDKFLLATEDTSFMIVSNGPASRDVIALRRAIQDGSPLSDRPIATLCPEAGRRERFKDVLKRTQIWTRCFPSDDDTDPAKAIRLEIARTLGQSRLRLAGETDEVLSHLWMRVFEAARTGAFLDGADLLADFERCGLSLQPALWSVYPIADRFYEQSPGADQVAKRMRDGGVVLVSGIGGAGKSTLVAEASRKSSSEGCPPCWIDANALLQPDDLIAVVASYLADLSRSPEAERLRNSHGAERPRELAAVIQSTEAQVVIDRVDRASEPLGDLIGLTARAFSAHAGSLLITSREVPDWWHEFETVSAFASVIRLQGLPMDSAVQLLVDADLGLTEQECRGLADRFGGHPQSLSLIRAAAAVPEDTWDETGEMPAQQWILERVIAELPDSSRAALAALSVFDYPIERQHACDVIGADGPLLLSYLLNRDLVRIDDAKVSTHDVIRDAAVALLPPDRRDQLHQEAAERILQEMEEDYRNENFVLYEKSLTWAAHLEALSDASGLVEEFQVVLSLDPEELRSLFAIDDRGFPFDFGSASLSNAQAEIAALEERGLVEPWVHDGEPDPRHKRLKLRNLGFFSVLLVRSLCLRHAFAGHIGYVPVMEFNHAYQEQWLICPWEHCIELLPLRRDRPPLSCPVFGHDCPGGERQAEECRNADGCVWDKYQDG